MKHYLKKIHSPVGDLHLIATDKALISLRWHRANDNEASGAITDVNESDHEILIETEKQLNEYFKKQRRVFEIPLSFEGTEFQQEVWKALLTIPFGETRTYGQIAKQIGLPKAVRAVGGAANKNPIAIIAPCHRVIGSSGKLTGFGGGMANKSILLQIENFKNPTLWDMLPE